jgi:hypothetical protein
VSNVSLEHIALGAHGDLDGDPVPFVRDVEKLSRWLVAQ